MGGDPTTEGIERRRVVVSLLAPPPHSPDQEHERHAGCEQQLLARQNDVVSEEIEFEHSRKRSVTARPYLIARLGLIVSAPAARRRAATAVHSGPPVPLGNQ